jgi:hypothetical protein
MNGRPVSREPHGRDRRWIDSRVARERLDRSVGVHDHDERPRALRVLTEEPAAGEAVEVEGRHAKVAQLERPGFDVKIGPTAAVQQDHRWQAALAATG